MWSNINSQFLSLILFSFGSQSSSEESKVLRLQDILPPSYVPYDKDAPPKFRNHPAIVFMHITLLMMDSFDQNEMTFTTDMFLALSWRDHRLRIPEEWKEDYRILDVRWISDIWRPDCIFKNAKEIDFQTQTVPNHYLWLYKDQTLLYMVKLTAKLSCGMDFTDYPHDTQICFVMIESLSHTTEDLIFKWNFTDPLFVNPEIRLPQLEIETSQTEDCTINYSTGTFTCLAAVFKLRRNPGYLFFSTYIPSVLIVIMSWISFWIPPESTPARVTLGVTSLLTLATQNTQTQQSLPPVSYTKAIDVWMATCIIFVFLSLIEFAVVNALLDSPKSRTKLELKHKCLYFEAQCTRDQIIVVDKISRFFFPLSYLLFVLVFWNMFEG